MKRRTVYTALAIALVVVILAPLARCTVSSTTTENIYSPNGSTSVFAYTFKIFDSDDIYVAYIESDGTETEVTSGFSVSGVAVATGGNVTFDTDPASGTTLLLRRQTVLHQNVDLVPNARLRADTIENEFDKLTFMVQDQKNAIDRAVKFKAGTSAGAYVPLPEPVALGYLMWNVDADGLINDADGPTLANATYTNLTATTLNSTTLSAFGLSLLDDADASAGRTTLGLGTIATQDADAVTVDIVGGSVTGITDIALADGGTGASSAAAARINLGVSLANLITDDDGDTTVKTETTVGSDEDTIILTAGGVASLTVTSTGFFRFGHGYLIGSADQVQYIRRQDIRISDGSAAATIRLASGTTGGSLWNATAFETVDDIAKTDSGTYYSLDASGSTIIIEAAGIEDNKKCLSVLGATVQVNYSTTNIVVSCNVSTVSGDISIHVRNDSGAGQDLTSLVDTGDIYISLLYITNG